MLAAAAHWGGILYGEWQSVVAAAVQQQLAVTQVHVEAVDAPYLLRHLLHVL